MICGFDGDYTDKDLKIRNFDLKMVNNLARNHPCQKTMFLYNNSLKIVLFI